MKNHGIYSLTARHNSKYGVVFFVNINPYYTKTEEVTSYVLFLTLKIRVSTRNSCGFSSSVSLFLTLKIRVSTRTNTKTNGKRTVSYLKNKGKYKLLNQLK